MTNSTDEPHDAQEEAHESADAAAPHDALFYATFEQPQNAIPFLQDRLHTLAVI